MNSAEPEIRYGTSWRGTLVLAAAAFVVIGVLLAVMRSEVLASSMIYQGTTGKFSSSRVVGEDVGFGMAEMTRKNSSGTTNSLKVLRAGFATGRLNGFCFSQVQSIAPIGSVTIKIKAGDNDASTTEISAVNVQLDVVELRGAGAGVNLDGMVHIGLASQDITTLPGVNNPLGAPTGPGYFGIDATKGDLSNLRGFIYNAKIGGPMNLPGLKITVVPGGSQCDADGLPN